MAIDNSQRIAAPASAPGVAEPMLRTIVRRFLRHRLAAAGVIFLLVLAAVALLAPAIWGDAYREIPVDRLASSTRLAPGLHHPFGTDELGRDVLVRIIFGGRISLSIGLVAAGIAVSLGSVIGAVAGYYGGAADAVLMRLTEVVMVLPFFFLVITVVAFLGPSIYNVMTILGLVGWTGTARLVRGEFLSLRNRDFVEAARASGAGDLTIIFRHLLPNAMAPILVAATLGVADAIITEAALSFFGLGVPSTFPSWGNMLQNAQQYFYRAPWLAVFPGLFIVLTVLSINFIGDALRDALDPRLKS